jgi:acyl-CoA dehydrogenase
VPEQTYLHWPFFTAAHRDLQRDVEAWRDSGLRLEDDANVDASCRSYVAQLGAAGWLKYAVPFGRGGALDSLDLRSICVIRDTLA